ncbi:MAG TPA: Lrp/AsnC family transcriptional regulator [Thermohalobaculum sp.]|nr:Lrp/AsnC family transcriptional regulator [Thermohalobaculum sp.]
MDALDRSLIAFLRTDARTPVASLAAALGVSRATVKARLDKLLADGTIQGFTVVLNAPEAEAVRAITLIEVEGRSAEAVIRRLRGFPEVRTLYSTNGRWDVVAEIEVASLPAFDETLRRIREVDGITVSETSILLALRKGGG